VIKGVVTGSSLMAGAFLVLVKRFCFGSTPASSVS
jgi:hypothetical protein